MNGTAVSDQHPDPTDTAAGSGLGSLLAQLQVGGVTLTRQQLAAAQALIQCRQQDLVRGQAFVSAMWGMSVIGGPLFFQQEMDALCQVGMKEERGVFTSNRAHRT